MIPFPLMELRQSFIIIGESYMLLSVFMCCHSVVIINHHHHHHCLFVCFQFFSWCTTSEHIVDVVNFSVLMVRDYFIHVALVSSKQCVGLEVGCRREEIQNDLLNKTCTYQQGTKFFPGHFRLNDISISSTSFTTHILLVSISFVHSFIIIAFIR